jgi:hypothetical protein
MKVNVRCIKPVSLCLNTISSICNFVSGQNLAIAPNGMRATAGEAIKIECLVLTSSVDGKLLNESLLWLACGCTLLGRRNKHYPLPLLCLLLIPVCLPNADD